MKTFCSVFSRPDAQNGKWLARRASRSGLAARRKSDALRRHGRDDLVTAGMGAEAMTGAAPGFADPASNSTELRRASVFFRASKGQGYGRLFGPHVDGDGKIIDDEGRIAGDEILAYADDGAGRQNVAMLLQIPSDLSTERRCLIAIPGQGLGEPVPRHRRFRLLGAPSSLRRRLQR